MLILRMMWKDWGFTDSLFAQAQGFLNLAIAAPRDKASDGNIRATIMFSQMAFEAYFRGVVRGYIQQHRTTIPPASLQKVELAIERNTGIMAAVRDWPKCLTGKSLDTPHALYRNFTRFTQYRNALVHGAITAKIPSWGKIVQDVETIDHAALAQSTTVSMVRVVAAHFDFTAPAWAA